MSEDAASPFLPGQAVQHKTGGPKMIYVGDSGMTGLAICNWMAGNHKQSETFHHSELQPYAEPEASSGRVTRG